MNKYTMVMVVRVANIRQLMALAKARWWALLARVMWFPPDRRIVKAF
ncbi:hypothetical protein KKC1_31840 [Calderihabitans maritimus]|uniref:Uncharacterized protein n=1 Tax=Calderihabitans maritimus TaxID=1246530 RepID=A0A1Z5HX10_9FIRM|nr:hypothetical protein KKC1_31840 [Calderihabitans maritimus]